MISHQRSLLVKHDTVYNIHTFCMGQIYTNGVDYWLAQPTPNAISSGERWRVDPRGSPIGAGVSTALPRPVAR
jgi:hypothetical protein